MTAAATRKIKLKSWTYREDHGDRVREPVRDQSRWPHDAVCKGFSRHVGFMEERHALAIVDFFHVQSRSEERLRTGRDLHGGELQDGDLRVLKFLLHKAHKYDEVYPTRDEIKKELGLGLTAVDSAKDHLRDIGVLDWLHRAEPIEDAGPGEFTVRQTSNLYRINELPGRVQAAAPKWLRDVYRQAVIQARKEAAAKIKGRNASAADLAAKLKAKPKSELVRTGIAKGLAAARGSVEGAGQVPDDP